MAGTRTQPAEVVTDRAAAYPGVLDELLPGAPTMSSSTPTTKVEADHGRLKARLRPMRGLKTAAGMRWISLGHAFVQDVRRGHYELGLEASAEGRLAAAFAELARVI